MEYISVTETAERWGITRKRVQVLCAAGRISGAQRVGMYWAIPSDAQKPSDRRKKTGGGGAAAAAGFARDDQ